MLTAFKLVATGSVMTAAAAAMVWNWFAGWVLGQPVTRIQAWTAGWAASALAAVWLL